MSQAYSSNEVIEEISKKAEKIACLRLHHLQQDRKWRGTCSPERRERISQGLVTAKDPCWKIDRRGNDPVTIHSLKITTHDFAHVGSIVGGLMKRRGCRAGLLAADNP